MLLSYSDAAPSIVFPHKQSTFMHCCSAVCPGSLNTRVFGGSMHASFNFKSVEYIYTLLPTITNVNLNNCIAILSMYSQPSQLQTLTAPSRALTVRDTNYIQLLLTIYNYSFPLPLKQTLQLQKTYHSDIPWATYNL